MTSFIPGSLILYHQPGSGLPPWPSIYCTDDVPPKAFLRTRPLGYVTPILKLAGVLDASQLRWATTTDLHEFDPHAADKDTMQSNPGLADAYTVALEVLESDLDLDHWKAVLGGQDHDTIVIDSDEEDDDSDNDPEMRLALTRSLVDFHSQKVSLTPKPEFETERSNILHDSVFWPPERPGLLSSPIPRRKQTLPPHGHAQIPSRLLATTPSPPRRVRPLAPSPWSSKRPGFPLSTPSDDGLLSPSHKRKLNGGDRSSVRTDSYGFPSQSSNCTLSPMPLTSDDDLPPIPRQKKPTSASELKPFGRTPEISGMHRKGSTVKQRPSTSASQSRKGSNTSAAPLPNEDVIEESLEESSQFVQVFVGPKVEGDPEADPERKQHRFQLMKCHVWERPYFRNAVSAHSYLTPIGENTWELEHPRLSDILPDDFKLVAEFLSDGDFGHRLPQDEEQVAETFAQCISAWESAELLSMDDLLDHIVEKTRKTQPWWDMVNVMVFACSVYQSEMSLQAHDEMKALLSEYIADFFYVYIGDDHLSGHFLARLQQLPELERDVFEKKAAQSNQRLPPREEAVLQNE
ncbi:uncharacterized protein EKO05_0005135 [Ascochyta rabiei]|uniref:Uncharacterized protein n=1 Tax=Didymella rabiei TaxID=5454 RepID=A0A162V7H3_DIDRA|nr:uncharacterized protein EKO05_0005135 [Ascochyta rabiei]KZM18270.1 hypothetical protein ST47_g10565 [Ascochyta rabiei]UPX14660.1 hypothetical protein EKO05_0005135 [Ascochyta rabiei]